MCFFYAMCFEVAFNHGVKVVVCRGIGIGVDGGLAGVKALKIEEVVSDEGS